MKDLCKKDDLRVVASPHPFKLSNEIRYLTPGISLSQILKEVQPDVFLSRKAHIWVNNDHISADKWGITFPQAGSDISINVVPQGGGIGRIIGAVFVAIAAIAAAVFIPGLIAGYFAAGSMLPGLIGGIAAIAVGIVGNMVLNALIPPTGSSRSASLANLSGAGPANIDYGTTSPTLQITGASNKENLYGPVPKILGKHRMAPPYGARTYTETAANVQYLRILFVWGFSRATTPAIQLEDLRIGETPLGNLQAVETEHRNLTLILRSQTIAINVTAKTLTRTTGSWIAEGIAVGGTLTLTGCTTAANNTTYLISAVTALVLTYTTGTATTTEAGTGTQTASMTFGDDDITLYPVTIDEEALAVQLLYNVENTQTSGLAADELSVDITCPSGLIGFSSDGSTYAYTITFTVTYRETGTSGSWLTPSGVDADGNSASSISLTGDTKSAVKGSLKWSVTSGQYDVKIKRNTADDGIWTTSVSYWSALRTITNADPIQDFPCPLAKTAMRIKATGQLNGTVDEFKGTVTSIVPDWDAGTSTWITRATQNPASLYREVVQGNHNQKPLADARLNLTKLQAWHVYCNTEGWKYNKVIDYVVSQKDLLDEIAASGRAAFSWIDSTLGVIIDQVQSFTIGPAFTPRNIVKSSFHSTIAYPDLPHGWRVQFINEEMNYEQDERIVLDDNYQINGLDAWGNSHPEYTEATIFEQLELSGITDPELVFRHGRYHLAQARLRPETVQFTADFEWLVATRGDRIKFAHDVMLVGLSWGRVTAVQTDITDYISGVTLDEEMVMEEGTSYVLRFRLSDNTSLLCPLVTDPGTVHTVVFETPINPADPHPAVDDLALFGPSGSEAIDLIIKSIQPNSDLSAVITAVAYDETIYDADQGVIPAHSSVITVPTEWLTPVITDVRSGGSVLLRMPDGSWQSRILALFSRPSALDANITGVETQYWVTGSAEPPTTLPIVLLDVGEISIYPVEDGKSYDFKCRYVKRDGSKGSWCATETEVVEGKTAPPNDVTGFMIMQVESIVTAIWTAVADLDLAGYEIRYGATSCTWAEAYVANGVYNGTTFSTTNIPPGTWDFLIKAKDTSGNYSDTEARKTFQVFQFYTILSQETEYPLWGGTLTNFIRNPLTGYLNPDDQDIPDGDEFDVFDNYVVTPYTTMTYETPEVDLGGDEVIRLWARIYSNLGVSETGSNIPQLSIDYKLDGGAYDGFEDWTVGFIEARYVKSKVTVTASTGILRLTNLQVTMDQAA